jgi:hypothetical protein
MITDTRKHSASLLAALFFVVCGEKQPVPVGQTTSSPAGARAAARVSFAPRSAGRVRVRTLQQGGGAAGAGWTAYLGAQSDATGWAHTVRGVGRDRTAAVTDLSNNDRAQGRDQLVQTINAVRSQTDVVLATGGIGSALNPERIQDFLNRIASDRGQQWRSVVQANARALYASGGGPGRVYWQLGNEINARGFVAGMRGLGRSWRVTPNDPSTIQTYAEYYLAPTVEALRGVAPSADAPKIILGSIGNAGQQASLQWLNDLLNYRFDGRYAPSLRGKRVADVVDVVAIHYLMTESGDEWREKLDRLASQWIGNGSVRGIWGTEELGIRAAQSGNGGATALRVTGRWLDWALSENRSPEQVRFSLYGWGDGPPGTRGGDAMDELVRFLGDVGLKVHHLSGGQAELHMFETADGHRAVVIGTTGGRFAGTNLSALGLPSGWGSARVTAMTFSNAGSTRYDVSNAGGTVRFPHGVQVSQESALLLELER